MCNAVTQPATVQSIPATQAVPVHRDIEPNSAVTILRPNAPVFSQRASSLTSQALLSDMQSWSLEHLDQHISLLSQLNQPIPHSVAILRSEAERKLKKKNEKRVANRKSASNSRARKKALVEEMTKTNARLKKHAMILALLPDLVISTTVDGMITFCSAQAERILQFKSDDLVGGNLFDLLVPLSRHSCRSHIEELVNPGKAKAKKLKEAAKAKDTKRKNMRIRDNEEKNAVAKNIAGDKGSNRSTGLELSRGGNNSTESGAVAIVSEQSFPMSVVNVDSKQQDSQQLNRGAGTESNDNLDLFTSNGGSGEDEGGEGTSSDRPKKESDKMLARTSDDFSSLSSETKNLRGANNNLDRNVRNHNQRMFEENKKDGNGPKDDVTGAPVTANNASARLSSLEHCPTGAKKIKSNNHSPALYESTGDQSSSDDSLLTGVEEKKGEKKNDDSDDTGYNESNESREESSSSWSDTSRSDDNNRKMPLAPTCRICLIKNDLTTVWCEVTSSIRYKSEELKVYENSDTSGTKFDLEVLFCLRPIRDSLKKVDESLRFKPVKKIELRSRDSTDALLSTTINSQIKSVGNTKRKKVDNDNIPSKRPPKKRFNKDITVQKKEKKNSRAYGSNVSETDVAESLMLMNKSTQ